MGIFGVARSGRRGFCGLLGIVVPMLAWSTSVSAAEQACCQMNSGDRTCFDDTIGSGMVCPAGNGLGSGTQCSTDCDCTDECGTCVGKKAGNLSSIEVQLLGPPVFNGTNTVYRYRVCQIAGHDLSHWSLGLPNTCCSRIIGASGGRTTGTCGVDPNTGLFGLKFETNQGVADCVGTCGESGDEFTITLSGNATSTGCMKIAAKANGDENTSTACLAGPSIACDGVCTNDSQCNDTLACTLDDCDPNNPAADEFGCVHIPDQTVCNDSNPCTDDACVAGTGCVFTPDNSNSCRNDLHCDGIEMCVGGTCQPGTPPCNDGVACTVNQCNEATDSCTYTPNPSSCSNGLYCDGVEVCHPVNGCQPGTPVDCSHLDDICRVGQCSESSDSCTVQPVSGGQSCEDGQYCTIGDVCVNGQCLGSPRNCNDGVGCTNDTCDDVIDACVHTENDSKCDNSLFCDGPELCEPDDPAAGPLTGCIPGTPTCLPCACDENGDACVCDCPGNPCPDAPECQRPECVDGDCLYLPTPGEPCGDDGIACTTESCDGTGQCVHTPDHSLCAPDSDPCTDTICHPVSGCIHVPDDTNTCDDGFFCTVNDRCDGGVCIGTPAVCDDGVECTDSVCNEAEARCVHTPNHAQCPASTTPCLSYVCDPVAGCTVVLHDGVVCNDGLACTSNDRCDGGNCVGTPKSCNDGIACTLDSCSDATGACVFVPQHAACADTNPCTDELCVPGVGCVVTPDNTNICEDATFCNGVEICRDGGCKAGDPPCDDAVTCTHDSCNELKDVCIYEPDSDLCSDGVFCNGVEICHRKKGCLAGTPPVCSDDVLCTNDICSPLTDQCEFVDDGTCDDGFICNGVEVCDPELGCLPGTPPDCIPEVTCTNQQFECDDVGTFLPPVVNDPCSTNPVATCTEVTTPGKLPQEYTVTRSCSFTNECGNSDSCEQVIKVEDTTPPELTCPPNMQFECDAIGDFGEPIVSDNCDPDPDVTLTVETIEGDCRSNAAGISPPPKLIKLNTYTATDGVALLSEGNTADGDTSGNSATCTQRIEIVDTQGPQIACPASVPGCPGEALGFTPPDCTDTCGTCTMVCTRSDGLPLGDLVPDTPLTIRCVASDECENPSAPCDITVATDLCDTDIPTVSQWGVVVLALLLLIGAKLRFSRQPDTTPN